VTKGKKKEKVPDLRARNEELEQKLAETESKLREMKGIAQRVQADYENAMKRREKEFELHDLKVRSNAVLPFLAVFDSINGALNQSPEDKGLLGLKEQFVVVLGSLGAKEIDCSGKFDHNSMECLLRSCEKGKKEDDVLEVIRAGYLLNGLVLRPAKVRVNYCEKGDLK